MFDPTLNAPPRHLHPGCNRHGAIMPMFAFMLPVLLVLCGFAINLAYMQKVTTELKVATDSAAHAGGRAMSIHQTTDAAIAQAELTAQTNKVGGKTIFVASDASDRDNDHLDIRFGISTRADNGYGMYEFTEVSKADVDSGAQRATSVAVVSQVQLPMVFRIMNYEYLGGKLSNFTARRRSIATQVDRDIALVLDRSGSMLYYKDETELTDTLYDLYNTWDTETVPGYWMYGYYRRRSDGSWQWRGYWKEDEAHWSWVQRYSWQRYWVDPVTTSERRISWNEYQNATAFLYDRSYSNNVIYQLERWGNPAHTLGNTFSSSESNELLTEMAQYTRDWSTAPPHPATVDGTSWIWASPPSSTFWRSRTRTNWFRW
jgi:Flp pilus assembly protein TadG